MCLFLPPWAKAGSASVRINKDVVETELKNGFLLFDAAFHHGDVISFHFDQELTAKDTEFKNSVRGYQKFVYGPMLFGVKRDKEQKEILLPKGAVFVRKSKSEFLVEENDQEIILSALCDVTKPTERDTSRQILFKVVPQI